MARSPTKGTRRLFAQMGIRLSSVARSLQANKCHPHKLQMLQHLTEDDSDRRVEFYAPSCTIPQHITRPFSPCSFGRIRDRSCTIPQHITRPFSPCSFGRIKDRVTMHPDYVRTDQISSSRPD
ncbi:hypothetical protein AVEN_201677-1 [Araneus ventricosus]|uniref:DUF4817 domain-containing protein n=1 Tax=Araneus ventricosus TaxID=182803 RepID=A0A4Y2F332_ARAVE|nr:hypothetical protein AVEN_201677-1 [Araneus ventricosus]